MKRRLPIIVIFLLLGAVVNVAVAWGLAASVNPFLSEPEGSGTDEWAVYHFKRAGVAYSTKHPQGVAARSVDARVQIVATVGWPLICSWYEYSFSIDGFGPVEGGLELLRLEPWPAPVPGGGVWWPKALPLRPIWRGFAINTLFYAVVLWLLMPGPFALRRLLRVRRGLCPKCAFPTGESSVCTECGKALAKHAVV